MEKYNIIREFEATDVEGIDLYKVKETDLTRTREFFAFIPLYIDKKFRWLKKVRVVETLYLYRKSFFSEIDYRNHYGLEKEDWRIDTILN